MAKIVAVKDITVGSILSDAVCSFTGKILLGKDTILTSRHISLLMGWDVQHVFITSIKEDKQPEQQETSPIYSEHFSQFLQEYDSIITSTAQSFNIIQQLNLIPVAHLKTTADDILSSITKNTVEIMNYLLISDPNISDFISRHSVMVAYFSGIIAHQMKWSEEDVAAVLFAALLHDVGNLTLDKIDHAHTHTHITATSNLLRNTKGLTSGMVLGIIQHRERLDSSGSPTGAEGTQIHPYARIIAVADAFHNLAYINEASNPFSILDALTRDMYNKFDASACQTLIHRVRDSLLFNKVILSNDQEAEIIFFHRNNYSSPIVKMLVDQQIIDLSQHTHLTIDRLVMPA